MPNNTEACSPDRPLYALAGSLLPAGLLWVGAATAAVLTGRRAPRPAAGSVVRLLRHPSDPAAAWQTPMPGPVAYWALNTMLGLATVVIVATGWWLYRRNGRAADPRGLPGLAQRSEIRRAGGHRTLLRRAAVIRPSLHKPAPEQVGLRIGTGRGIPVWASVEESMVILGPPRSGKGLHLVIPTILDAPGAVITTSTRPDNLTATLTARRRTGPVAVFDPQQLAPGLPAALRWSPIRGCDRPQTAMIRARALAAGTSTGVEGGDFWQAQTEAVLRGFLHAAALDGRAASDLYRWSLSPVAAGEATRVLTHAGTAAPGWADALDAAVNADPRTRDSIWTGVRTALAPLADPRVLAAVSPATGETFDPREFLAASGTLYLLGTNTGAGAAAGLIAAYLEDIIETARAVAAAAPGARLDPPLALVLDEVANYPLPSLPHLMSDGGGTGITTIAVLQSLAQARSAWGEHNGAAVFDAAIVKVILGGGSTARDLTDLATLIGDRDDTTITETRDRRGDRSTTTALRRLPILDPGRLRTLPFGTAVLLLRTAPPILLDLTPWTARPDAATLRADRASLETQIRTAYQS